MAAAAAGFLSILSREEGVGFSRTRTGNLRRRGRLQHLGCGACARCGTNRSGAGVCAVPAPGHAALSRMTGVWRKGPCRAARLARARHCPTSPHSAPPRPTSPRSHTALSDRPFATLGPPGYPGRRCVCARELLDSLHGGEVPAACASLLRPCAGTVGAWCGGGGGGSGDQGSAGGRGGAGDDATPAMCGHGAELHPSRNFCATVPGEGYWDEEAGDAAYVARHQPAHTGTRALPQSQWARSWFHWPRHTMASPVGRACGEAREISCTVSCSLPASQGTTRTTLCCTATSRASSSWSGPTSST